MHAIALGLVLAASAPKPAAPPPLPEVLKQATASHQPVLLDVYTSWCEPCARLAKEVFPRPEVQKALGAYRFVSYDAEKGTGIDVAERFDVHSYPSLLVLNPAGELVTRIEAQGAEGIVEALARWREIASSTEPIEERAKTSRDPNLLYLAARQTKDPARATALYRKVRAQDPKNARGVGAKAALALAREEASHRDAKSHGELLLKLARTWPASAEGFEALNALAAFAPQDRPSAPAIRDAIARSMVKLQKEKNADGLNGLVYAAIDLGERPAALAAAKALVALKPDSANELDTLAEAYFQAGDRKRALETEKKALALPGAPEAMKENLARFEKEAPTTGPLFPHRDPLAKTASSGGGSPNWSAFQNALQFFQVRLTDRLHAACQGLPDSEYVRLYLADGKVTRAVLLDPELDAKVRACAEKAAQGADHLPTQWQKGTQTVTAMAHRIRPHTM
jgi:tetratricopeptide (TPR) repeat protein